MAYGRIRPVSIETLDLTDVYATRKLLQDSINASKEKYSEIARGCGLSPGTISRLADGTTKDPRFGTAIRILLHFGYRVYAQRANS